MSDQPAAPGVTAKAPGLETRRMQGALRRALFGRDPPPVRVGRFAIVELIGEGGMGRVYLAYDPRLDRRVAVKVLHGRARAHTERLTEEALALARLNHPNVVTIYEVGDHEDDLFVAMEYVDGGTLERWCEPDSFPRDRWRAVVDLAEQAARGLIAAHAVGIVHRDLKPANMLIGGDGRLRLADFGLALAGATEPTSSTAGTPAYMAPEQFLGRADARSDQFSLCASLLHAFFGKRCHHSGAPREVDDAEAAKLVASLSARAAVPRRIEAALLRGLSSDPADRFPDVASLLDALRTRPSRRMPWILGAAVIGAGTVAMLGARASPAPACTIDDTALGQTWSPSRRDEIVRGLVAAGVRHAPATAERVGVELDRIATRWRVQRDVACAAEASEDPARRASATAQRACLAAAIHTFDALASRLAAPDAETVTRAADGLVLLGDLTDCRPGRPTIDIEDARALALQQTLHEGRIAHELQDDESAFASFTRILDETQSGELPRLRAIANRELARHHDLRDARPQARRHERAWLDEAEAAGDAELAAEAWASIAVSLAPPASFDDARFFLDRARGYARRGELTELAIADLDLQTGLVAAAHARSDEAAAALRRAVESFERLDSSRVANALKALSDVKVSRDEIEQALALRQRALQLAEQRLGPAHPDVASLAVSVAEAHGLLQDEAAALALLDDAVAVFDADPGLRPFNRAIALVSRGTARSNLGQFDLALEDLERADDLLVELLEPGDPARILALDPMARALIGLGRRNHALDVLDRAGAQVGDDDAVTQHDHALLRAELLAALDRDEEARAALLRAVALRPEAFAHESVSSWQALEETARMFVALDEPDRALAELAVALDRRETLPAEWSLRLEVARAQALARRGDREQALALATSLRQQQLEVETLPRVRDDLAGLLAELEPRGRSVP